MADYTPPERISQRPVYLALTAIAQTLTIKSCQPYRVYSTIDCWVMPGTGNTCTDTTGSPIPARTPEVLTFGTLDTSGADLVLNTYSLLAGRLFLTPLEGHTDVG